MEAEVKKQQIIYLEYRNGTTETHDDTAGYQVGGGVFAITFNNHSTAIIPLDMIKGVLIYNKE